MAESTLNEIGIEHPEPIGGFVSATSTSYFELLIRESSMLWSSRCHLCRLWQPKEVFRQRGTKRWQQRLYHTCSKTESKTGQSNIAGSKSCHQSIQHICRCMGSCSLLGFFSVRAGGMAHCDMEKMFVSDVYTAQKAIAKWLNGPRRR